MSSLPSKTLDVLRQEIDRIDGLMHQLLVERSEVINELIEIKAKQGGGSAFRPAREASMMRAIIERHRGILPLDTVEGIWRVIIATFTYVQSNYSVHVDVSRDEYAMRDSARFHFGFTVPCVSQANIRSVIRAVERSVGDLGMFPITGGVGAWWSELSSPSSPKIIARLPFVERPHHPAGTPVFVVARPLADGGARDVVLEAVSLDRWRPSYSDAMAAISTDIIARGGDGTGLNLLVARPGGAHAGQIVDALDAAGARDVRVFEVGAHAARFEFGA
jgi:chorismate mutase